MTIDVHLTSTDLGGYLHHSLDPSRDLQVREHIEDCPLCWQAWNLHLWTAARNSPLFARFEEFLGTECPPALDPTSALTAEWDAARFRSECDVARFFRTSATHLRELVISEASGYRRNNVARVLPALARHGVQTVLDYGCGIGSDTVPLHESGFAVIGCDFDSPSTAFLRWRSGDGICVLDPAQIGLVPAPDALWIVDMFDYLADIEASLGALLSSVDLLVSGNLTFRRARARHRFQYRHSSAEIVAVLSRHGLVPSPPTDLDPVMLWTRRPGRR